MRVYRKMHLKRLMLRAASSVSVRSAICRPTLRGVAVESTDCPVVDFNHLRHRRKEALWIPVAFTSPFAEIIGIVMLPFLAALAYSVNIDYYEQV